MLERIGQVAYYNQLPEVHDLFHVLLKPYQGNPTSTPLLVPATHNSRLPPALECILSDQLRLGVWHILVQWCGMALDDATWELLPNFKEVYPDAARGRV